MFYPPKFCVNRANGPRFVLKGFFETLPEQARDFNRGLRIFSR